MAEPDVVTPLKPIARLTRANMAGMPGVWVVVGTELLVYALIMALFLIEGGWILILDVLLAAGALVVARRAPWTWQTMRAAFSAHPRVTWVFLAALLLVVPLVLASSAYWLFILITAGLYLMAALGLNLQLGSTGMMNLASAAFMAFGAYTAGMLALDAGWPSWLTILAGPIVTGLFSILLFIPVLKTKGHYLALVTIAFQFMVTILLDNLEFTGGPQGLKNIPLFSLFGYSFNHTINLGPLTLHFYTNFYYLMLAIVFLLILVARRIHHSWVGVTLSTIRDDDVAAQTSGAQVNKWKLMIFVLGNCFIGLSGAFYSHMVGFISPPNFTFEKSLVLVSIVILGGMDNIFGIIAGSLLLIVLPEKLRFVQDYRFLIYGLVLIIMLIFRPRGILPFRPRTWLAGRPEQPKPEAATAKSEPAGKPL